MCKGLLPILCVDDSSNYFYIPNLDLYTKDRNAFNYNGDTMLICHPPCAQWSKLNGLAHVNNLEKNLGPFCIELVNKYGGIVEHPVGSSLFKYCGVKIKNIISVNQSWWGFPAQKKNTSIF